MKPTVCANIPYQIFTDSACDMPRAWLEKRELQVLPLTFRFDREPDKIYEDGALPSFDFYREMREGATVHTAAVAPGVFENAFRAALDAGRDILYIGFSSGLSGTYNAARLIAVQLQKEYPTRRIITLDSLCASAGLGLLLDSVVRKRDAGATVEQAADYAASVRLSVCHRFTVDDLAYLRRGGRISAVGAAVGGVLGIKPVLHMDNEGHLLAVGKVRGRRTALLSLVEQFKTSHLTDRDATVFICHADCAADAAFLAEQIHAAGGHVAETVEIGSVIGSHSGPGTVSLFYWGKER